MIPLRTSVVARKTPYINYSLIAINVIIFALSFAPRKVMTPAGIIEEPLREWANIFMLYPLRPQLWQFISYAFLHGSIMHIAGNMYFLYVFGNNVNERLGSVGYLAFYLSGAVFSALGHSLFAGNPVLGASGAVAAVTGAYLVLFPQSIITVLYWFIFIGTIDIPAIWFIGIKLIVIDNVIIRSTPYVAYDAHLAGYAFGILSIMVLLAFNLLSHDQMDLWRMLRQWNRRRQYRDAVSSGYDPFTGKNPKKRVWVSVQDSKNPQSGEQAETIRKLRGEIASHIAARNLHTAGEKYGKLLEIDPDNVLPRQNQLDIANFLMSEGKWHLSAQSYELFLKHYPNYVYSEQVQLMLGILYARYLNNSQSAKKYLSQALDRLSDERQKNMCQQELDKLKDVKDA